MMPNEKKGKATWRPANKLKAKADKRFSDHRLRWCDKDPANIQKKLDEGWEFVNQTGLKADHSHVEIEDGANLTSVNEYRELVLMALPEDMAQARDEFYRDRTRKQTLALKDNLKEQSKASANQEGAEESNIYGKITIE